MTSKKFSHNPFGLTLLRSYFGRFAVSCFATCIYFVFFSEVFSTVSSYKSLMEAKDYETANAIIDGLKFVIYQDSYEGILATLVSIFVIAFSVILAFSLFSYMMTKNATNVYYSIGMSRNALFASKYLSGILLLSLPVIFTLLVVCIKNVTFFGNSSELWICASYIALRFIATSAYYFTVTAMVMILLGSYIESIFMTIVCVAAPAVLSAALPQLVSAFNICTPFLTSDTSNYITNVNFAGQEVKEMKFKLFDSIDYFMPANGEFLVKYGEHNVNNDTYFPFSLPSFKGIIIFVLIVAVLALIAGRLHYMRKTEKAGFMGSSPVLFGFVTVVLSIAFTAFCGYVLSESSEFTFTSKKFLLLAIWIVLTVFFYTLLSLLFVRSAKLFKKRLPHLLIECGVALCLFLILGFGVGARMKKLPEIDEIQSAAVTVNGASFYDDSESIYEHLGMYDKSIYRIDINTNVGNDVQTVVPGFTDENDLKAIIEANSIINNVGNGNEDSYSAYSDIPVSFIYTLKNGRTVKRFYRSSGLDAAITLSTLLKSENYINIYSDMFENLLDTHTENYGFMGEYHCDVAFASSNMTSVTQFSTENSKKWSDELIKAVAADMREGTMPFDYNSDSELLGYILFEFNDGTYTYEENIDMLNSDLMPSFKSRHPVPVYADMKNTAAVIEKYDLGQYIENTSSPVKVMYCRYSPPEYRETIGNFVMTDLFCGQCYSPDNQSEDEYYVEYGDIQQETPDVFSPEAMPKNSVTVTDKAEIDKVMKNFRMLKTGREDNTYAQVTYDNGTVVYGFLDD